MSFLQFFEPDKNQFPFSRRLGRNSRSSLLFSLFHLSLSSASSTMRSVQFHLFLSLTAFVVYFICFFLRLSYRPSEHKAEASLTTPSEISIILQRRFLIKLLQPRPRSRCSALLGAVPPVLRLIFHPIYSDHLRSPWFAFNAPGLPHPSLFPCLYEQRGDRFHNGTIVAGIQVVKRVVDPAVK